MVLCRLGPQHLCYFGKIMTALNVTTQCILVRIALHNYLICLLLDLIRDPLLPGLMRDLIRMLRNQLNHIEMKHMIVRMSHSMTDWLDPLGPLGLSSSAC